MTVLQLRTHYNIVSRGSIKLGRKNALKQLQTNLDSAWDLIVDNMLNTRNVKTSRRDISSEQQTTDVA